MKKIFETVNYQLKLIVNYKIKLKGKEQNIIKWIIILIKIKLFSNFLLWNFLLLIVFFLVNYSNKNKILIFKLLNEK